MCGSCKTCPFGDGDGWSPEAEQAMALGCVPEPWEIMGIKRDTGLNWGCHSAEEGKDRICAGFVRECHERGIEYRGAKTLSYADWYQNGVPTEIAA